MLAFLRGSARRQQAPEQQSLLSLRVRRCLFEPLEARLVMAAIQEWQVRGVGGGGALFSPSINPTNPSEMYIASDMGQVFHTTSEGAAWETLDHREMHGSHSSKMQFTVNPQILYSLDYTNDLVRPTKSIDGGANWTPLAGDPTGGEVYTLAADYNNSSRLLVSDYSRLFLSTNGGTNFTQRFSTADANGLHIAGVLFDGNNIYVGTNQGVLVSTNGGTSFSVAAYTGMPTSERIVSFAGAKEGGTTRFWAVTMAAGDIYAGVQGWDHGGYVSIYRIDVGQTAWTASTSGITAGATPFYVSAATNDIDTVYVSGGSGSSRPTVFRSSNGGANWQSVLQTVNNANVQTGWSGDGGNRGWSYGENALGFSVSPLDSSRLLITDFGFAHYSEDSGATWRALYVTPDDLNAAGASIPQGLTYKSSGLENTTSWGLTWTSPANLIGSFSDIRGAVSADGGDSWSFNYTGHTQNSMYRSIVHPTTGVVYAATSTVHDMYQSTYLQDARIDGGSGNVLFSTNGGAAWQTMHNFNRVVTWVEADPTNSNRLYAAVAHSVDGGIYVTNNAQAGAASTWTKLANPPRTEGHAFNIRVLNDGTLVVSYSGRRTSGGAFTASSGVFVSTDGGQTWADRSHTGMRYWTKDVVIDPHDPTQNTWYASVFSGWGGPPNGLGGLYRTTDRGVSWTRINALDRVNSITVSPTNPNEAYLTTEVDGLWYTENLRATNPTFTHVDGYRFMQPMRVVYNPYDASEVWVTSFGGGLRVGNSAASTLQVSSFTATATGFIVELNRAIEPSVLNLYDEGGLYGAADVIVSGATTGAVQGSMVIDPGLQKVTFIKTGGALAADTYTVTLKSSATGFHDENELLLDGNADGASGGDYVRNFTVASPAGNAIRLSVPDLARAAGQAASIPGAPSAGIPIDISQALGVKSVGFSLAYDPALLTITGATIAPGITGAVTINTSTPGLAQVSVTSTSGLSSSAGAQTFVYLTATVPVTASYGAAHLLDLKSLQVLDTSLTPVSLPAIDDDGLHVASYFGDASASQTYNAPDATLVQWLIVGMISGFGAYRLADPFVVADVTGNGQLQSNDVTAIQRAIVGLFDDQIPPLSGSLLQDSVLASELDSLAQAPLSAIAIGEEHFTSDTNIAIGLSTSSLEPESGQRLGTTQTSPVAISTAGPARTSNATLFPFARWTLEDLFRAFHQELAGRRSRGSSAAPTSLAGDQLLDQGG